MAVFLRGSSYYVKIRRGGRQVLRSLNTGDKGEALARARGLIRSLSGPIDTAFDTTQRVAPFAVDTLGLLFEGFKERTVRQVDIGHVRPSYRLEIESLWRAHLSRFSGRLVDLQLDRTVIDYLERQGLSVARRRKAYSLFRKLAALVGLKVAPHRFQSARPPKQKRPLTVAQLQSCKAACLAYPNPIAKLIYLAAVTGARIGEMMALTPEDIGADCISISKTKCRKTGAVVAAKSRSSRRTIPVAPEVLDIVRPAVGTVGHEWFPVWRAIRKRAGLGKVGVHVLRHTWATHALGAGITPKAVSLALGHASVSFTEAQYASFLTTGHFKAELAAFNR